MLKLDYAHARVNNVELNTFLQKIEEFKQNIAISIDSPYAFLSIASESLYQEQIKKLVKKKQMLNPKALVLVGIGGSNLGTVALEQALGGEFFNQQHAIKIYYADTVDADYIADILAALKQHLDNNEEILINVISKSGKTTETIANFALCLQLLQQYKTDYKQYIVITTDKDSALWMYAQQEQIDCLEIPSLLGGRYSVFSAVSLFPLALLGFDIDALIRGAKTAVDDFMHSETINNTPAIRASLLYSMYHDKKIMIHDLFVFSKNLAGYSLWYRQLMAESIGKEYDNKGNKVEISFTPTASIGSTDLHSVAQLYLADSIQRFTTFVEITQSRSALVIPTYPALDVIVPDIAGISLSTLMVSISKGVQQAYAKKERPFCTLTMTAIDEYSVAYLMQTNMIEICLLGFLLDINPFNQPNVELYKKEVREMLGRNG